MRFFVICLLFTGCTDMDKHVESLIAQQAREDAAGVSTRTVCINGVSYYQSQGYARTFTYAVKFLPNGKVEKCQ